MRTCLALLLLVSTGCGSSDWIRGPGALGGAVVGRDIPAQSAVVHGRLTAKDAARDRGIWAQPYRVELSPGDILTVSLSSGTIDCYIQLYGPGGTLLAEDDDSGGSLDSFFQFRALSAGPHTVVATSYSREVGPYMMRVTHSPMGARRYLALQLPSRLDLVLQPQPTSWGLRLEPGHRLVAELSGQTAGSRLRLFDGSGTQVAAGGDASGGPDTRLEFSAPAGGTFFLTAASPSGMPVDVELVVNRYEAPDTGHE